MTMTHPQAQAIPFPLPAPALTEAAKDVRDRARHLAFGCSRPFAYDYARVHLLEGAERLDARLSDLDAWPELRGRVEELVRRVRRHEWWAAYGLLRSMTPTRGEAPYA